MEQNDGHISETRLDGVKNYLSIRCVPYPLQERVINWFDYLWYTNKITDEDNVLNSLPDKLKAEIAIQMHLDTLKRVEIFQNTEEGFLSELVLRLRMVLFAPGDYVCRKGEIGKQMFIVNRGTLHVLGDDSKTILATLRAGSYFGELSILNLGQYGNRRTASVRSLGYSDLFRLSKSDLWDVLKDYPGARRKLELHAYKKISEYKILGPNGSGKTSGKLIDAPYINVSDDANMVGFASDRTNNRRKNCGGERMSRDGSDGYGSDPSRLSAPLCTPQQSPTPPVTGLANEHELLVSSSHPLNPIWGLSNPPSHQYNCGGVHFAESDALIGQHLQPIIPELSTGDPRLCVRPIANGMVTDRTTQHTSAFDFFAARTTNLIRPKCRNLSVPADLMTQKYCVNYMEYDITDKFNAIPNEVCHVHHVSEVDDNPDFLGESTGTLVQFSLNEASDDPSPLHPSEHDVAKANRTTHESNTKTVPVICFEQASTSSSSCSPDVPIRTNNDSVFSPSTAETVVSSCTDTNSPGCLVVPRGRVSSSSSTLSSRSPYPCSSKSTTQPCQLMSLYRPYNHSCVPCDRRQSCSEAADSAYEALLKELMRLQRRVNTLEQENSLLSQTHQMSSFDEANHGSMCYPFQESAAGLQHTFVKRSASLQVPSFNRGKKGYYRPIRHKLARTEQFTANIPFPPDGFEAVSSGSQTPEPTSRIL
ncbi:Cyclic nucleotide-gated cation channel subunit A [Clonorchis sinensis]|uniref:Cyclic nucleotide-gated cation channel subunit A n=1 Tax=Clonorchis sinensis TaxID=79923 RepID=A0A419Q9L9_CLOSI|nr:Cyclic nucleotide-gated cation channel subunit A [Clonorchis sinensis]